MAMSSALGSASATIELNVSNFIRNANAAGDAMVNLESRTKASGAGLMQTIENNSQHINTVGGAFTIFGGIVTGAMGVATNTAMDFEAAMSAVAATSGASAEQLERAEQVILDIGYQTTLSATEAAAALEILIKAGVELDDALDGIALAAVNLSEATGVDITVAAETAAAAMNIFGYSADEANRVMDAMSQSSNASALDISDWTLALKYAGPVVSALGWDIEDLADMMIILGDAGIRGEVGATAIRNILLALSNPTQDITDAFGKYNVELFDVNGNLRSMSDITADLAPAWDQMSQAEKLFFAELVAGKQGVTSFTALMEDQAGAVRENGNAFDRARVRMEAAGTTQEMAAKRMDNLAGSVEELKGTIETLAITFLSGLTPAIRWGTDALSAMLQQLLRLPGWVQTAISSVVGITGVLALFTGGGMLAAVKVAELVTAFRALGGVAGVLGGVTKAVGLLQTAMLGLFANPVVLGGAAFLGTLFLLYKTNFMGFGDAVRDAIGWVEKLFAALQLVFGTPSQKDINVSTVFDEGSYYITSETLPDGTKKWNIIEDETGGTFGEIIQSYTDSDGENSGTTYILIEPADGGPAFWAKADLENSKPESIEVPILAEDKPFKATMETVRSATGDEVTVLINGDGEPFAKVIGDIITDPTTGKKQVTIELPNGDQWVAEVDEKTGSIVPERAIKITADSSPLSEVEELAKSINKIVDDIRVAWMAFNGAIQWTIDKLLAAYGIIEDIWGSLSGDGTPQDTVTTPGGVAVPVMNDPEGIRRTPYRPGAQSTQYDRNTSPAFADLRASAGIGAIFRDAAEGSSLFDRALQNLVPNILSANTNINKTASTVPMYTSSTQDADKATGAMATNMGASFGRVASDALVSFTKMQSEAVSRSVAMNSFASANAKQLQSNVSGAMAGMSADAAGSASSMNSKVTGSILGMQVSAALQMATMASTAESSGTEMSAGMTGWLLGARVNLIAGLALMVGSVRNAGSAGYSAGYYAGSQIGAGMAAGMNAWLGAIAASANAMVAAASRAVMAKAMIASPSKLFKQYGEYIGQGMEQGILGSVSDVHRAASQLIDAGIPQPSLGAGGYGGATVVNNYYTVSNQLASPELIRVIEGSTKGGQAYAHLNDPDAFNYGGGN